MTLPGMPDPEGGGPLGLDAETMLMTGGFVLVFALIVVFMTFTFTPILMYICIPGGVLPAAVALGFGGIEWHREKQLQEFATFLQTYRRIRMDELARKIGKTEMETDRLLTRAIELKYVDGVVDRATGEFVLASAEKQQVFVERCPHCGGVVNRWAFPEERFPCPYCDVAVEVPAAAPSGTAATP